MTFPALWLFSQQRAVLTYADWEENLKLQWWALLTFTLYLIFLLSPKSSWWLCLLYVQQVKRISPNLQLCSLIGWIACSSWREDCAGPTTVYIFFRHVKVVRLQPHAALLMNLFLAWSPLSALKTVGGIDKHKSSGWGLHLYTEKNTLKKRSWYPLLFLFSCRGPPLCLGLI